MKKKAKIVVRICLAIVLVLGIGCGVYLSDYYRADDAAMAAMTDQGDGVEVEKDGSVTYFIPDDPVVGLIFYPGGKVQCEAYAPLMRACAKQGILCALVHMPGNLAVFKPNAADGIQEQNAQIDHWYIGGHSLGGAMAASYAGKHTQEFDGLILLAAYSTGDISQSNLKVLSIYGSKDGVLNRDSYEKNRANLPGDTIETVIDGGCHAFFGCYGAQKGDGEPTITNEEQITQTAKLIADLCIE